MPNVYRKKNCPVCGVEHRKRGPFCSRSHATQGRVLTDEHKEKLRQTTKRHMNSGSDAAEKSRWILAHQKSHPNATEEELEAMYPLVPHNPAETLGIGQYEIDTDGDLWQVSKY
jgi:hypothetical protein